MNNTNQTDDNKMLEEALRYHAMGFFIIPIRRDKHPLVDWKRYQTERATSEQIKEWWKTYPEANVAALTGAAPGIVAIDVDKGGDESCYPATVRSRTGGGGSHFIYKHPGVPIKTSAREIAPFTDVRGEGGCIVLPPSIHQSGKCYEWAVSPENTPFAGLPESLLKRLQDSTTKKTDWKEFAAAETPEGKRNDTATQYAGKLLHELPPDLWETAGWDSLKAWNQKKLKPPVDEKELRGVFESVKKLETAQREEKEESGENQADRLVKFLCNDPAITLFRDELNVPYIRFDNGTHKEILPIGGSAFKHWIAKSFYDLNRKTLNPNVLATALQTVAGKARFDGEAMRLHNRAAMIDGEVWYDLADKAWRAVKVTADGWSVIDNPPTIFKRQQQQAPQVIPVGGGDIRAILRFVNISDESQQLLFLVLLVSYFIPGFPHPICYVYGPQGSAKSTVSKIARRLVDPSRLEVLSLPRKDEELAQVLSHNYMLFFDNVGHIGDSAENLLCRAVTGSGFSKRQLFTDDDDIIYAVMANVGINGIALTSSKPDLFERSILFELRRIEKADRREESELTEEFERECPKLLGSIFDAVAKALALRPSIRVASLPRMADFARWGCALAEAMGFTKEAFLDAYAKNIESQNDEVLAEHVEPELLNEFMADKDEWTGSFSELLAYFRDIAKGIHVAEGDLPKSANALSRKLGKLKTNLEEVGFKVIWNKKSGRRSLTVRKASANIAHIVISPEHSNNMASVGGDFETLPPL